MRKWAKAVVRYYHPEQKENIMTNEERWVAFIVELRAYIEEHMIYKNLNDKAGIRCDAASRIRCLLQRDRSKRLLVC